MIVKAYGLMDQFSSWLIAEIAVAAELEQQVQQRELEEKKIANKFQGLKNNLRGLSAEFETAKVVPGLVGVSCTFPLKAPSKSKNPPQISSLRYALPPLFHTLLYSLQCRLC